MHRISLKDWVNLLTILPTTVICLFIAGYFSYNRYSELENFLIERSTSIIEPLAISSAEPVLTKQRDKLRHIIGYAHRSQSSIVKSIAVFTHDNQIFVTSAYHNDTQLMRLRASQSMPEATTIDSFDDYLILRTPIVNELSPLAEIELNAKNMNTNLPQAKVGYIAMIVDKNKIQFSQQSQTLIAFAIAILGALISAIFSLRLIKNVTRPISSMVQAVDRIREGKLESRISGQLVGELNFLKNGVNAMAQSLGDYHDEMQRSIDQATIDLRDSLEQFEIQNVELDIAKRKAQDANKVKSEFLANMSHELRTPLNGVIGFTRQVLKTPLSHTQRDHLQTIESSAANLLSIINDILDFSKLDAGKMILENIPFSLREMAEEALTLLAPNAHLKNIELSVHVASNVPDSLLGDAMRIKQVVTNLVSNAIKFTDKGCVSVNITSEKSSSASARLKFEVVDTGIGISTKQKSSLFEAFGQADKSITRLYGGTGLGLVISQRLAHEMNGNIGFNSEEGVGSTFWFTFTCGQNPIPLFSFDSESALRHKHIIYYEPHKHTRVATNEMLIAWHMEVDIAQSLSQVLKLLSTKNNVDFVFIGLDNSANALFELKKELAQLKKFNVDIHIALNTNSPNVQETIIASGAKSCISKPIMAKRLYKELTSNIIDHSNYPVMSRDKKLPIKVLAVDDNEANLTLIKALLLEQVADVTTATNGQEALDLCYHDKFAMVFMDIQMPVMDGISALRAIRANTFNNTTPIIAVTAHALISEKDELLDLGFDFYMTKPIDEIMLRHTIYEYCDLAIVDTGRENLLPQEKAKPIVSGAIDWTLALERAGNKATLAKDMLQGLTQSLPETKQQISEALTAQDITVLQTLIHKLNGACCYTGVPNLGKVTHHIESSLKQGVIIEDLEPEFMEFFEHIDNVVKEAPKVLDAINY